MSAEVVVDCRNAQGNDNLGALLKPPIFDEKQLAADMKRGGMAVNDHGRIKQINSLEALRKFDGISPGQMNYVLLIGQQGLGGGGIPMIEVGTVLNQDSDQPIALRNSNDTGNVFRSLSIQDDGSVKFVSSMSYDLMDQSNVEGKALGKVQLSLVVDLKDVPQDLSLDNDMKLNIPAYLVVSGDSKAVDAIRKSVPPEAIVTNTGVNADIRQARDNQLYVIGSAKLLDAVNPKSSKEDVREVLGFVAESKNIIADIACRDILHCNAMLDNMAIRNIPLSPKALLGIAEHINDIICHNEVPGILSNDVFKAKEKFFTTILSKVDSLSKQDKAEFLTPFGKANKYHIS